MLQFAFGGLRWLSSLGHCTHHDDQCCAIEEEAEFRDLTQKFGQTDQCNGTHDDTGNASHSTDHNEGYHINRYKQLHTCSKDGANQGCEDGASQTGECCAQYIGQEFCLNE